MGLKYYIVWYDKEKGMNMKFRKHHKAMETLTNKILVSSTYEKGSMRVLVGSEELKTITGVI